MSLKTVKGQQANAIMNVFTSFTNIINRFKTDKKANQNVQTISNQQDQSSLKSKIIFITLISVQFIAVLLVFTAIAYFGVLRNNLIPSWIAILVSCVFGLVLSALFLVSNTARCVLVLALVGNFRYINIHIPELPLARIIILKNSTHFFKKTRQS